MIVGCARPLGIDGALTAIPYSVQDSGRIVVDVLVNDRGPYRFAIDTAATGSFAFFPIIEELQLEPVPGISMTVYGAVATGTFPVVDVERVQIGSETWADTQLTIIARGTSATASIDGVLGADFLKLYSVGFSRQDGLMRLYHPTAIGDRAYAGWTAIRTEARVFGQSQEPLRYLNIEVGSQAVSALFDLGAGVNILNSAASRALQLSARRPADEAEFSGAVGQEPVLARLSSQQVRTGTVRWRNETFLIADLEIFETLQATETPLAILGSGIFNQRDFIIDFPRERLLVRSSMQEQESDP